MEKGVAFPLQWLPVMLGQDYDYDYAPQDDPPSPPPPPSPSPPSPEVCGACTFDYTANGSPCCDTAWTSFALDCATLSSTYGWDCSGCSCPGDPSPPPPPSPAPPPPPPPSPCTNLDGAATDPYGDGCSGYTSSPHWCGGYDDTDFSSNTMCCACGGGG
eukprot:scaffold14183_cov55-Phaeocystis_antarctica.AAC.1